METPYSNIKNEFQMNFTSITIFNYIIIYAQYRLI